MMHQVAVKDAVKAEFVLGLAAKIAAVSDAMSLPHVRERLAEMITTVETLRACLRAAEADAQWTNGAQWMPARAPLDTARNLFPRLYPRMIEMIQLNCSSSLMAMPSEADFASPLLPDLDRYLATAGARRTIASRFIAWPGTSRAVLSADARCSTSGSSSAIRYAWPVRWSIIPICAAGRSRGRISQAQGLTRLAGAFSQVR